MFIIEKFTVGLHTRYCKPIYFCNIPEVDIFAKINHSENMVRPLYVMRKGKLRESLSPQNDISAAKGEN